MANQVALNYLSIGCSALGLQLACARLIEQKRLRSKGAPKEEHYGMSIYDRSKEMLFYAGQAIEDWLEERKRHSPYSFLMEPDAIDLTFRMIKEHYPAKRVKYSRKGLTEDDLHLIRALEACPAESSLRKFSGLLKKFASSPSKITNVQLQKLRQTFEDWHAKASELAANAWP